ncbi:cytochrome d ubiquinol oxidase subunit II [Polymorphobacter fuscus]|uniref:Cytochrome d ubiquinol oxidase subunit II n=1 Tax=Sandarakinorhabdus fusca TaxID=1439888 RepID=A0A7C9KL91_9SPHN|nr:cytochrome d ubiquinol oxidase subunit II [Polymorphobacter fuscus]KAB7648614.1 cytochrome d ubiquinol oxidase subunit II [Polymorphobacter fuscus]MQT16164.1 cytochrome d ubiquinol oxidase subunit II [Polymorphobacter fuscus]NJC07557.1 cytochrome d ubiquinol oxidase subunit II [Polymorphobacter fuscus]
MAPNDTLTLIWAGIIALAIFGYVVMDGFDLGIGILFPWLADKVEGGDDRNTAINTIAPVWDGNETWLVLGGGGLFAAFPLAYAIVMPAVYTPLIAMLMGLIFRGVAFEYRARTTRLWIWDRAFAFGSVLAAFSQGVILGAVLQGVKVKGRAYAGGWFDWLSPFSVLTGVSVVAGYALLGACWLIYRTEGALQERAFALAKVAGVVTLVAVVAVSAATPFLYHDYFSRWFERPGIFLAAPVPIMVGVTALLFIRALRDRRELQPFLLALALFLLSFIGLGISMMPWIIPGQISIYDAATPANSQSFMLVGVAIMLPIIIGYTAYAYWVFRGKVGHDGYH